MPITTCWPVGNGAEIQVQQYLAQLSSYANETLTGAMAIAEVLGTYQVPNLSFNIDLPPVQGYALRDGPVNFDFNVIDTRDIGDIPTIGDANTPRPPTPPGPVPPPPADAPAPVIPPEPPLYDPVFAPQPPIDFPLKPVYGDYTGGIPFPTLFDITLPPLPDINLDSIVFGGIRPTFDVTPPDPADFTYLETPYSPILVDQLKSRILDMMNGLTGLPVVVENAIWERQADREGEQASRSSAEAISQWASRGFTLPGGPVNALLARVRQTSQNARNTIGREVMIRIHEVLIDQLKTAIANGIALEELMIRVWISTEDRKLQAARFAIDIAINVFNARIAEFQAFAELYKVDAEVYSARIEAELGKIKVYAEEIHAQELIGEINKQAIEVYSARLNAIELNVRIYLANVQAYTQFIQAETLKLTAYRETIDVELGKLQAAKLRLDMWTGELQGEQLKQQAWETRVRAYNGMVQAWSTEYQADLERFKGDLALIDSFTNRYRALIEGYTAKGTFNLGKARLFVEDNAARVQRYSAESTAAASFNDAMGHKIAMINDSLQKNADLAMKNGEINLQNALAALQLMEQARQVAAQVLAQLAGGAMSALSVQASISDQSSTSASCNYSISSTA